MNDFYNCPVCGKPSPSPVGCGCTIRDTIEWACKWVEWPMGEDGALVGHPSVADIADAVRVKCTPNEWVDVCHEWADALYAWGSDGPLAFIKAVREVIDNG